MEGSKRDEPILGFDQAPRERDPERAGNPGSDEAIADGCKCPPIDNGHGWGYLVKGQFVIVSGCPLHARKAEGE